MYQYWWDFSSVRGAASSHLVTFGEGLPSTLMMSSKWWVNTPGSGFAVNISRHWPTLAACTLR